MLRFYRLGLILLIALVLRLWRLEVPRQYVFDEVYHVPTFRAFSQNNPAPFDVYAKAPEPGTAYDWLHPPLAKLIQAGSIKLWGDNSFGWRFPSAILGVLSIAAVYYLAVSVTKKETAALLAALIFSLDNLQLTMSRVAMNDIFVTTFILFALAFFYQKKWLVAAVFTGLAISTKHSALLLYPIFLLQGLSSKAFKESPYWKLWPLVFIPPIIYLLSFGQFWLQGHSLQQFIDLHKQIYYYQTHLTATHAYQSPAWQWPLLIRPVWFYVNYGQNTVANIYNLGNPIIFWLGLVALIQGLSFGFLILSYLGLWLPFIASPRIMFLHHYLPALAVLTVILGVWLGRFSKKTITVITIIIFITFIFFYPINTAIALPSSWLKYWFWLPSWR